MTHYLALLCTLPRAGHCGWCIRKLRSCRTLWVVYKEVALQSASKVTSLLPRRVNLKPQRLSTKAKARKPLPKLL